MGWEAALQALLLQELLSQPAFHVSLRSPTTQLSNGKRAPLALDDAAGPLRRKPPPWDGECCSLLGRTWLSAGKPRDARTAL